MILEIVSISLAILIGIGSLIKYLLDCFDRYISKQLSILEAKLIREIQNQATSMIHCRELRLMEMKVLNDRITDIENYLDKHEDLDFKIRKKHED